MPEKTGTVGRSGTGVWAWTAVLLVLIIVGMLWLTSPGLGHARPAATLRLAAYWTGKEAEDGPLQRPMGIAVAPDGTVYVTDAQARVVHFSASGAVLGEWGHSGDAPGQFSNPVGLAVASDGSVYVSDYDLDRVEKFTADGQFLSQFGRHGHASGELDAPAGLAVGRHGSVYVADFYNDRIEEFSPKGKFIRGIGTPGRMGIGSLHYPTGITALPHGGLLVADAYNYELQWFDAEGRAFRRAGYRLFGLWPRPAHGETGFAVPTDAAVVAGGLIVVADSANHRVALLSPDGKFESAWRIPHASRRIFSPEHIAVSPDGRTVYATDFAGNRIIVLHLESHGS